ncbi:hypothetical protein C2G38_2227675 [Gigaspora rosea]|uniref:Uncharacterized protein n=1 Tax=Gigaspora rosea TaxID=44941 RepID=A0A397U505_9GLOM|nr:hypothetical protein C2G38_2227675 [Gigaspora rosea]
MAFFKKFINKFNKKELLNIEHQFENFEATNKNFKEINNEFKNRTLFINDQFYWYDDNIYYSGECELVYKLYLGENFDLNCGYENGDSTSYI